MCDVASRHVPTSRACSPRGPSKIDAMASISMDDLGIPPHRRANPPWAWCRARGSRVCRAPCAIYNGASTGPLCGRDLVATRAPLETRRPIGTAHTQFDCSIHAHVHVHVVRFDRCKVRCAWCRLSPVACRDPTGHAIASNWATRDPAWNRSPNDLRGPRRARGVRGGEGTAAGGQFMRCDADSDRPSRAVPCREHAANEANTPRRRVPRARTRTTRETRRSPAENRHARLWFSASFSEWIGHTRRVVSRNQESL